MTSAVEELEARVLVLAPIGRDAKAAVRQLGDNHLCGVICSGPQELYQKLMEGAAAALIAEEAFLGDGDLELNEWVAGQPPWSDFPFIVLTSHHTSAAVHAHRLRLLEALGNVSLLERPLSQVSLVSAVQTAVRARRRQYQVRDHLIERERAAAQLEDVIRHRTQQLIDTNQQLRIQIAERKEVEAALLQAQKMEVIGQMTGGVAHDFNNLLTAVLGNLELASRRGKDASIRPFLDGATQAARRGAKLTSQLLAFSRAQRLQLEPTDLNKLIVSMGDLLSRTIGGTVIIETTLQDDLWPAMMDASQVELVILNLAINARDAMPGGGGITISTANIGRGDRLPGELLPADYIALSVRDSGTGMGEEVVKKAYEPFFTTKGVGRGTGLGLSQVYGIAKQSGGGVRIDTQLGQGTTVTVYFRRAQSLPARHSIDMQPILDPIQHHATILVVDDDRDVREVTVSCLESLGYRVIFADGGRAALETIDHATPVDLLLVDMVMPEMTGTEVARAVLDRRAGLPVIYMTGYVDPDHLDIPKEQSLLKKPFSVNELAAKVEEALQAREA
jgi:signal transduction histidine kinase